jgi:hypothetical protein
MRRLKCALVVATMLLVSGCGMNAGNLDRQVSVMQTRGSKATFYAKGEYQSVYQVLLGRSQGLQMTVGIGNNIFVHGVLKPNEQSGDIITQWSNAMLGNQVMDVTTIRQMDENKCEVDVWYSDMSKQRANCIQKWLQDAAMFIE